MFFPWCLGWEWRGEDIWGLWIQEEILPRGPGGDGGRGGRGPGISDRRGQGILPQGQLVTHSQHIYLLEICSNIISKRCKILSFKNYNIELKFYYRPPEGGRLYDMKVVSGYAFLRTYYV